jgi:hypothetical protein
MPVTWIDASVLSRIGGSGIAVRRTSIPDGDLDCLQADSLPDLIQARGYLKYRLDGSTFLRGQSSLHEGRLEASLMRGAGRRQNRDTRIERFILSITLTSPAVSEERRGLWWYRDLGRVVDLRVAVPSYYVRPHAQQGYLIRPQAMDGSGLKVAVVRIPPLRALEWLGSSVILSPFGIYPPATVDDGYRQLLDRFHHEDSHDLGTISVVGPGY